MEQAGSAAHGPDTRRRRKWLVRGLAWLPVCGVAAIVALTFAHGYNPLAPQRHPPKRLAMQPKPAAAATQAVTTARDGQPPAPVVAPTAPPAPRPAIEPVASAAAPGGSPDGNVRLAASLIPRPAPPKPAVVVVAAKPRESAGKPPSAPGGAHPVQVAALTPIAHVPNDRPLAVLAPPAPPKPWQVYARPFDLADKRPRIALVVAGADDAMDRAIDTLPAAVTLALDPYARRLPDWIELARAKGHEVLLTLSAPTIGRGRRDAGPMAILSSLDPKENLERLDWALGRTSGFVGVLDIIGDRPANETGAILARLEQHGLMLVSGTAVLGAPTLPLAVGDLVVTPDMPRRDLEQKLRAIEDKAQSDGHAIAIGIVGPQTLRLLAAWLATLSNKSIALAPATALIAAPPSSGIARE